MNFIISVQGHLHHLTYNHWTHPDEGNECLEIEALNVKTILHQAVEDCEHEWIETSIFDTGDDNINRNFHRPQPPKTGVITSATYYSELELELELSTERISEPKIVTRPSGIELYGQLITWGRILENGSTYVDQRLEAFWNYFPLGPDLTDMLYNVGRMSCHKERDVILALLDEMDFISRSCTTRHKAMPPEEILREAGKNPEVLYEIAFSIPWDLAKQMCGPSVLKNWLIQNHPQA